MDDGEEGNCDNDTIIGNRIDPNHMVTTSHYCLEARRRHESLLPFCVWTQAFTSTQQAPCETAGHQVRP